MEPEDDGPLDFYEGRIEAPPEREGDWWISVTWQLIGGRLEPSGLRIRAAVDPPKPITAGALRTIRLAHVLEQVKAKGLAQVLDEVERGERSAADAKGLIEALGAPSSYQAGRRPTKATKATKRPRKGT